MNAYLRITVVSLAGALAAGCGSAAPAAPTNLPAAAPVPVKPQANAIAVYGAASGIGYQLSPWTMNSQLTLYDDSTFVLTYRSIGADYGGHYTRTGDSLAFQFNAGNAGGDWRATGTIAGSQLTIRYNVVAQLADFEDCVYVLETSSSQIRVYAAVPSPEFQVSAGTLRSRFILRGDGTFVFEVPGGYQAPGLYTQDGHEVRFVWSGKAVIGPWEAIGTLDGDRMAVRYNFIAHLDDFEDCMYQLVPSGA